MSATQFLEFIVSVSCQVAVIVCFTYWLCRIVEAPRLQCQLWNICHLLVLTVTLSGLVLPHLRVAHPWQSLSYHSLEQAATTGDFTGRTLLLIWGTGVMVSLALLIREWVRVFRFVQTCREANDVEAARIIESRSLPAERTAANISRVRLLISDDLGSPFCCQWHRPCLVFPEFMLEYPTDELRYIARHEVEHLRSGHPLQLFIERLVGTAFWFHPAISWASRQALLAREYACDDVAVNERLEIVSYLKTLLAIAERGLSEETGGAKLFFGRGASIIALRGRRLVARAESAACAALPTRALRAQLALIMLGVAISCAWVPLDALASGQTHWSPWPQWSAQVLRSFDIPARDFEPYETRSRLHEISVGSRNENRSTQRSTAQQSQR